MRITVNGVPVAPINGRLLAIVNVDPGGDELKSVEFRVNGGPLTITGEGRQGAIVLAHDEVLTLGTACTIASDALPK
mgnify:CR=1 FL=1